jgi:thiol-disulfide isomerase/thioredoxin
MNRITRWVVTGIFCCAFGLAACAAELGDPAPALQIAKWIKGKQVELTACKTTSVVVVDLWATWCPFCIESIPHLTELQKKYGSKCVQVVGISAEEEGLVKDYVGKQGDKMHYSVALDRDQATSTAYQNASKQEGIPQTFIVDKEGRLVWYGPPMQIDKPLESVVAGNCDLAAFRKQIGARAKIEELWRLLGKGGDESQIKSLGDELAALDKELESVGGIMPDGKSFDPAKLKNMAEFNRLGVQYQKAILNDETDARIDEIAAKMKACALDEFDAGMLRDVRVQLLAKLYIQEASSPAVNETNLVKRAEKMVSVTTTNANLLNEIAWTIHQEARPAACAQGCQVGNGRLRRQQRRGGRYLCQGPVRQQAGEGSDRRPEEGHRAAGKGSGRRPEEGHRADGREKSQTGNDNHPEAV